MPEPAQPVRLPALEESLEQAEGSLLPGCPMADPRLAREAVPVGDVPIEVAQERLPIGVARLPAELPLRLVDGDERILGCRLVDPLVEGRDAELVERV